MISGITENENNKEKERKHWIPNQVGDDIGVVFGDDSGCVFEDNSDGHSRESGNPESISSFLLILILTSLCFSATIKHKYIVYNPFFVPLI